ncbi:beta-1,4-galactosyltransferase 1-like [Thalassophryne amazonica]|uniref:beta-1,4-galactosyltransferase 1-like n=1 Tax=Thalassophryne amazonica TaxID=390379 RepID=UPI001470A744|nr:beta-1,4-galactosyltransferase 1-like [Thalassophryne amazonica]
MSHRKVQTIKIPRAAISFNLLNRICKLVVLLCIVHIVVTVIFYIMSLDIRTTFVPNQQSNNVNFSRHLRNTSYGYINLTEVLEEEEQLQGHPKKDPLPRRDKPLEQCPETSPLLKGPLEVDLNKSITLEEVKKENPNLMTGGCFRPKDCKAQQKVAIIIPFRNREQHLKYWLHYLHPILQRQQLEYGVYVINQYGDGMFNKARLMNSGFMEVQKEYDYECFVFSDVDIIPMNDYNIHKCFSQPRHIAVLVDKFGFQLPYTWLVGGIIAMSKEQFQKINGFSNNYFGWGGEDDDLYKRIVGKGMSISRPSSEEGKCRMIQHNRDLQNQPNPNRFHYLARARQDMDKDGINSLSYTVINVDRNELYTNITIDVGKPDDHVT